MIRGRIEPSVVIRRIHAIVGHCELIIGKIRFGQDGVPGISSPPIPPGGSADYDFPLQFGGTFWMHSHEGLQEQELLAAPLIISDSRDRPGQQDVIIMLADFSFTPPEQILEGLRKAGGMKMPAIGGAMSMNSGGAGMATAVAPPAPDLNDVKYDAFLANDRTLADPEVIRVRTGGTVLLRIINSSSMSAYHIDLGALHGELIAVDGTALRLTVMPTACSRSSADAFPWLSRSVSIFASRCREHRLRIQSLPFWRANETNPV